MGRPPTSNFGGTVPPVPLGFCPCMCAIEMQNLLLRICLHDLGYDLHSMLSIFACLTLFNPLIFNHIQASR